MTNTENSVPTPMSRTTVKAGTVRREMARLGFKKIILNKSKGKSYQNVQRGRVTKDYVEFFTIPTKDCAKMETETTKYQSTFGWSFSYIDKEKDEQTVEVNYQEKMSSFSLEDNITTNTKLKTMNSQVMSIPEFNALLDKLIEVATKAQTPEEFFEKAITLFQLQEVLVVPQ